MFKSSTIPRSNLVCVSLIIAVAMSACSITEELNDRNKIDYKSAGKLPPLDIPPDLNTAKVDERFKVPERADRTLSGFEKGKAAGTPAVTTSTTLLPSNNVARIERAGAQRWLTVALPAEKVWPVLREFWQESGFMVEAENQTTGVLETNWAENRAKLPQDFLRRTLGKVAEGLYSTSERDKFRSRIERSTTANATEIYISHRGMTEVYVDRATKDQTRWQVRPSDPELEVEFLQRLLVKLGATKEQAQNTVAGVAQQDKAQMTAAAAGTSGASGASGSTATTLSQISLSEPFDRAWRRVGLALDRTGFTVEDRDRTQGLYFVRYIDPEVEMANVTGQKPGFFGGLFTSKVKPSTPSQYRIKLLGATSQTQVNVLNKDGKEISDSSELKTANKIMAVLLDQLK
jgi:outer membrane protein assembly factor BamC